jgi:hypothetical protein
VASSSSNQRRRAKLSVSIRVETSFSEAAPRISVACVFNAPKYVSPG